MRTRTAAARSRPPNHMAARFDDGLGGLWLLLISIIAGVFDSLVGPRGRRSDVIGHFDRAIQRRTKISCKSCIDGRCCAHLHENPNTLSPAESWRVCGIRIPGLVLLDVRLAEDFAAEHLRGAVNNCVFEVQFLERMKTIAPEWKTPICCYGIAEGSLESPVAAEKLLRAGYNTVFDLAFRDFRLRDRRVADDAIGNCSAGAGATRRRPRGRSRRKPGRMDGTQFAQRAPRPGRLAPGSSYRAKRPADRRGVCPRYGGHHLPRPGGLASA